jgi:peptidoglycan/xylan/chitin deacetylase (PgdA/CDA1 family)
MLNTRDNLPVHYLFPGGKSKAVTLSYDDGAVEDRQLVSIFNRYGLKGTFHINSGGLDKGNRIAASEVKELYSGHEVACHFYNHPFIDRVPPAKVIHEILADRMKLESIVGYPVRGLSYSMGVHNRTAHEIAAMLGIAYSRTTVSGRQWTMPENWLAWNPTCRHADEDFLTLTEKFIAGKHPFSLFYAWGHSFEFERLNNWQIIEKFGEMMQAVAVSIWFATNIEIFDYVDALQRLRFSADCSMAFNPSVLSVWLQVAERQIELSPGKLTSFNI